MAREAQQIAAGVDLAAVKARQQIIWGSGDFSVIGTTLQSVGESLCEALDLESGSHVLDVACGNGNAALAAARRWGRVTGLDYVPALLERAAERARAERLELQLLEGDAERLPFDDSSFDMALSTFGVMFAPDQAQAARELMRVVKPGGKIGLANWTPTYKAFGALDAQGQARLGQDLELLAAEYNRRSTSFVVPGEYLEVAIER